MYSRGLTSICFHTTRAILELETTPQAFFVTKSGILKNELNYILNEILDAVHDSGFKFREMVIFDQGRSTMIIADDRTSIVQKQYFIKNDHKIYFIFYFLLYNSIRKLIKV